MAPGCSQRLRVNRVVPTMRRARRLNPNDRTRRPARAASPLGHKQPLALQKESRIIFAYSHDRHNASASSIEEREVASDTDELRPVLHGRVSLAKV
jgi:hypothetical protein